MFLIKPNVSQNTKWEISIQIMPNSKKLEFKIKNMKLTILHQTSMRPGGAIQPLELTKARLVKIWS